MISTEARARVRSLALRELLSRFSVQAAVSTEPRASASGQTLYTNFRNLVLVAAGAEWGCGQAIAVDEIGLRGAGPCVAHVKRLGN